MGTKHRDYGKPSSNGGTSGGEAALHRPGYWSDEDPAVTHGTGQKGVDPGQMWVEHASGDPDTIVDVWIRNNANDGWVLIPGTNVPPVSQGDMIYADGANSLAALGGGSEHDVLVYGASTAPEWKSGLTDDNIAAAAEIAVAKLADGTARQLLQTDAAGTGVEWTSDVDIPGTLDVTGAGTFDSTLTSVGAATLDTGANGSSFGGRLTVMGGLTVSGVGPHAFGGSVNNFQQLKLDGSFTSGGGSTVASLFAIAADLTGANGDTNRLSIMELGFQGGSTITTQGNSETIADVASLVVGEPVITVGTGDSITNASTVKIVEAPTEGTNNYALWVASGATELGGTLDVTGAVTLDSTLDVTGILTGSDVRVEAATPRYRLKDTDSTGDAARGYFEAVDSADATRWRIGSISSGDLQIQPKAGKSAVFSSPVSSVGAATLDTGANGSSFGGDLTISGNLVSPVEVNNGGSGDAVLTVHQTADGFNIDPIINLRSGYDGGSGAAAIGRLNWQFKDTNGNTDTFSRIEAVPQTFTSGAEDGDLIFLVIGGGSLTEHMRLKAGGALHATFPNTSTGTGLLVATNDASEQEIFRDSSTLAHKRDVAPTTLEDARRFLDVDAISYEHRGGHRDVGFGAEHVHDAGLEDVVTYVDGEPAGFKSFGRGLIGYHHRLIQDHESRINRLESALA